MNQTIGEGSIDISLVVRPDQLIFDIDNPRGSATATQEKNGIGLTTPQHADDKAVLFIKADRQWLRLNITGILYIESLKDYVRVVTTTGEYIVHQSLTDITSTILLYRSYLPDPSAPPGHCLSAGLCSEGSALRSLPVRPAGNRFRPSTGRRLRDLADSSGGALPIMPMVWAL